MFTACQIVEYFLLLMVSTEVLGFTVPLSIEADGETFRFTDDAGSGCEDNQNGDLYLSGVECGRYYVLCRGGTVIHAHLCPDNTVFDPSRQACYDLSQYGKCRQELRASTEPRLNTFKPRPTSDDWKWTTDPQQLIHNRRQVKFLNNNNDYRAWLSSSPNSVDYRDRRDVKFSEMTGFEEKQKDKGFTDLTSRHIDFYPFANQNQLTNDDYEFSRDARQVKFRSLEPNIEFDGQDGATVVGKKHATRQIKFGRF